ncbi:MAG: hypothetical protein RI568_13140 [Natronomonas sp.]|uniref:hypothetical protein n=1 Tax=Natronomonas sp. TaxID=2184060 RepID=UPI0028708CF2|nr:hypothetical protein [Natronomonas sp.]MDR9431627.1 hypothetical protein [Natronomonas sp.]
MIPDFDVDIEFERLRELDREQVFALASVAIILLAVPAGFVVAQSLSHQSTTGVTYQTNSGVTVTLGDAREVEASPFDDDNTFADGNLTISGSDAELEITDQTYNDADNLVVQQVEVTGSLTVDQDNLNQTLQIEDGDVTQLQLRDYGVDNGQSDIAYASNNGVTVTLDDLPSGVGIGVVDTSTGDVLDSVTTSEGEETFDLPSGTREAELQTVPSELQVRNESAPDQLIDGDAELRFRAFYEEDGEEEVIERPVTNGTVALDGLPADEQIVVTVREESADYVFRRILLDNIVEQSEIYLLPTSEPAAEVDFRVQDQTGRFEPSNTQFFVEKAVTRNGETDYRVISGDELTASGSFPTILEDSERYRLRVENDDGEQRVLGSYVVQGAQIEEIPIGDVEFSGDVDEGAVMQASIREAADGASHNHEVRLVYVDPNAETDSLTISIENSSGDPIRPETTEELDGETDIYTETFPLNESFDPEEDTATVIVEAESGFETETFERTLGDIPDVFQDVPVNPRLLELMFLGSIVMVVGLLVIFSPPIAALVGPGYAGLLVMVGLVPIPMPAVVLAGVVGILAVVGDRRI